VLNRDEYINKHTCLTNIAEWTSSAHLYSPTGTAGQKLSLDYKDLRVIAPGYIADIVTEGGYPAQGINSL
jgi:hypothetical protein